MSPERQKTAKVIDFFGSERKILFDERAETTTCPSSPIVFDSAEVAQDENTLKRETFESTLAQIDQIQHARESKENDTPFLYYVISFITVSFCSYSVIFVT